MLQFLTEFITRTGINNSSQAFVRWRSILDISESIVYIAYLALILRC
jgi:hypothetical protein